jgi:hypothetical protein
MSGLEPLAVFGLACNVMQVLSFSHETISLCKSIFRTGSLSPNLANNVSHLSEVCESLNDSLNSKPKPLSKDQQKLLEIAQDSLAVASQLKAEVNKIDNTISKGKLSSAITGGLKATWRKGKIEKLEKSISSYQRTLESSLLAHIW